MATTKRTSTKKSGSTMSKNGNRAERRTVQVARATFRKAAGNQTANTPGRTDDRRTARKRTAAAARKTFKTMPGNQTPDTPGKRESAPRKKRAA
jgi:hypothetical protein